MWGQGPALEAVLNRGVWWQMLGFRVSARSPGWHLDQVFLFDQMYGACTWRVKAVIVFFDWVGAGLEVVILIGGV